MARRSAKYDDALGSTRAILTKHDPIALLAGGAPKDEYEPEAVDLVVLVLNPHPIDEATVNQVWVRWFGDDYSLAGSPTLTSMTEDLQRLQATMRDPGNRHTSAREHRNTPRRRPRPGGR